jgi:hypothetical protein
MAQVFDFSVIVNYFLGSVYRPKDDFCKSEKRARGLFEKVGDLSASMSSGRPRSIF